MQISRRFPLLARRAALALCLAGAVQAHAQEAAVQRKSDYPLPPPWRACRMPCAPRE